MYTTHSHAKYACGVNVGGRKQKRLYISPVYIYCIVACMLSKKVHEPKERTSNRTRERDMKSWNFSAKLYIWYTVLHKCGKKRKISAFLYLLYSFMCILFYFDCKLCVVSCEPSSKKSCNRVCLWDHQHLHQNVHPVYVRTWILLSSCMEFCNVALHLFFSPNILLLSLRAFFE